MRLKELYINNFKFFSKQDANSPLLHIDGRNLLIYGENGSGKSTIYWALYTLLESSFKKTDGDVQKYFKYRGEHGLVNVYASSTNHKSSIKAVLTDGATTTEYRISGDLSTVQAIRANSAVRESGMASDFINYRALFKMHHAKHSSNNDLFGWFEDEILPYIRNRKMQTFGEVLKELRRGPRQVKNLAGETVYANPAMLTSSSAEERKDYKHYRSWDRKLVGWTRELSGFLKKINTRANEILDLDFKFKDTKIKLELIEPRYNVLNTPIDPDNETASLRWREPEIRLTVPKYQRKNNVVVRPHSFLNEAKWTAIGLSIRMAILEDTTYRPSNVDLKCLVMDDMLLSLDMSNRDIVLDLLLTRYVADYQLILMTHDKYFFELAQYKINKLGQTNWMFLDMYALKETNKEVPLIIETTSKIRKAWSLFRAKELDLSANTLRKAAEKLCKAYLTHQERLNADYTPMNLHNMLVAFRSKALANGLDAGTLAKLIEYKDRILNPNSHYDIQTPLFENELEKAIQAFEKISDDLGLVI